MARILHRKGFELAISTIVVMILGILVIGGGLLLVARLTDWSTGTAVDLSNEQIAALKQMMSKGELVAVYPDSQTVSPGKSAVFGVGIENRLNQLTSFSIDATARDQDGNDKTVNWTLAKLSIEFIPAIDIEKNEQKEEKIVVTPDKTAPRGTYTIFVNTSYKDPNNPAKSILYESIRFFTVLVQ